MTQPAQQLKPFRQGTRLNVSEQPAPQTATAFSQRLTFQLGQTGYLASIALAWTATITGTGSPSGNWPTYPPNPFACIKQVRLYTSDNIVIVDVSGWGLYLYNVKKGRLMSWGTDIVSYLNTNNRALLLAAPSGAVSGGSNTITGYLDIPVITDQVAMLGMLNTQTNQLRIQLDVVTGSQTDIFGAASYATTGPFISMTVTPQTLVFNIPQANSGVAPADLTYAHYLLESTWPMTLATGDWIVRPPTGLIMMSVFGMLENASLQIAPANITQIYYRYQQNTVPIQETYTHHVGKWKQFNGFTPPDGYFDLRFDQGAGIPGVLDQRDWLQSADLTDLSFIASVTGLSISGTTQVRLIMEQLGTA